MTDLQKEYGDALYLLCAEEKIDDAVLPEIEALKTCFEEDVQYLHLLNNHALAADERISILDEAFRGKVHPYVLNFLKMLLERGAIEEFTGCVKRFKERYNTAHGIVEATVTTAAALDDAQRKALVEKLSSLASGRKIVLTEKLDPTLLGGVTVEMDGKRYDNTVRHRLEEIRRSLIQA